MFHRQVFRETCMMRFMTEKHKGGRGHKAANPYERFTASVPPHVLAALDRYARVKGVNRSEALVLMVERHEKVWPQREK